MIIILTGIKWYLIVILICISLMINDIEHLFIYLLAIFIYFGKMSSQVFYPFFFFQARFYWGPGGGSENSFPSLLTQGAKGWEREKGEVSLFLIYREDGVCPGVRLEWWLRWFAQRSGGVECRGMLSTLLLLPRPWFYSWLLRSSNRVFWSFVYFV